MEVLAFLEVIKGQRFFSVMPPLTSLRDSLYKFPSLPASFPKMPLGMPSCVINKVGNLLLLVNKIKRVDSHIDTPENVRWFALGLCFSHLSFFIILLLLRSPLLVFHAILRNLEERRKRSFFLPLFLGPKLRGGRLANKIGESSSKKG